MRLLLIGSLGLLFPIIILWSLTESPVERSLEWEMAAVHANAQVPSDHPTVAEFHILLDRLEEKCSNSRREIAEMCITAYLWQKERGNLDTLLEFTESVAKAIPETLQVKMDLKRLLLAMMGQ